MLELRPSSFICILMWMNDNGEWIMIYPIFCLLLITGIEPHQVKPLYFIQKIQQLPILY